jgi:hypothetical protein
MLTDAMPLPREPNATISIRAKYRTAYSTMRNIGWEGIFANFRQRSRHFRRESPKFMVAWFGECCMIHRTRLPIFSPR